MASRGERSQAGLVGASFALLLVGTNAANPLLPVYREVLGFDALLLSLTYVFYVTVLTAFFVIMARPSLARYAPAAGSCGAAIGRSQRCAAVVGDRVECVAG